MMLEDFVDKVLNVPYKEGGRDYSGVDCWGLCILAYQEIMQIQLPLFSNIYYKDMSNYQETVDNLLNKKDELDEIFEEVNDPQFGDLILCTMLGRPLHIGFVIDRKRMLHTSPQHNTVIENFGGNKWKNKIVGFYRYRK